jgi:hypothetical protein
MKKLILFVVTGILLTSCSGWKRIATLTVVSTRNYDNSVNYVELKRYVDSRNAKELPGFVKRSEGIDPLNMQILRCVSSVEGGEFLKNVQIFTKKDRIRIVGDVWGVVKQ